MYVLQVDECWHALLPCCFLFQCYVFVLSLSVQNWCIVFCCLTRGVLFWYNSIANPHLFLSQAYAGCLFTVRLTGIPASLNRPKRNNVTKINPLSTVTWLLGWMKCQVFMRPMDVDEWWMAQMAHWMQPKKRHNSFGGLHFHFPAGFVQEGSRNMCFSFSPSR